MSNNGRFKAFINYKFFRAYCAIAVLFILAKITHYFPLSLFLTLSLLFFPVLISFFYGITLQKLSQLDKYNGKGIIYIFLKGRGLKYIICFFTTFALSLCTIVYISLYKWNDWLSLLLLPLIYMVTGKIMKKVTHMTPVHNAFYVRARTIIFSSFIMLIISSLVRYIAGGYDSPYETFQTAVDATNTALNGSQNMLYAILVKFITYFDYTVIYLISEFGIDKSFGTVLSILGGYTVFIFIAEFLLTFYLTKKDLISIVSPLRVPDSEISPIRICMTTFAIGIFAISLYSLCYSSLKSYTENKIIEPFIQLGETALAEGFNGKCFPIGTIQKVFGADHIYARKIEEINLYHDKMLGNVDAYLNEYYTVRADYERMMDKITGDINDYMAARFKEKMAEGFQEIGKKYIHEDLQLINMLNKLEIACPDNKNEIKSYPSYEEIFSTNNLIKARVGLYSKVALNTAKCAGVAGIAAGIGSIVPIIGTAAGAIAGGVVCTALVALYDDENFTKESFKKEIIESIEESRETMLSQIENIRRK